MKALHFRTLAASLLALLAVLAVALAVKAAVIQNKTTGETLKGTVLPQRISGQNIFKFEDGRTRYINIDEWTVIEPDAPPAAPADTGKAAGGSATKTAPAKPSVYLIPISSHIEDHTLVEAFEKALDDAKKAHATVVVLHMNTPGGRLDLTDKIIKDIEKVDWAKVVAWIQGEDKEALSAGAFICFATQKIYMAPGCAIGAATPYRRTASGAPEVEEKMMSAFRARFRSLAQTRGYPAAIADAMVDAHTSAVQITLDGQSQVVTAEEAARLQQEHKSDGKFKMGKTINRSGQLITLTTDEAVEFKVCSGVAATETDLLKALNMDGATLSEAKWVTAWVEKTTKDRDKQVSDLRAKFIKNIEQADAYDPQNLSPYSPRIKEYSARAMACLQECAKALTELEKLAKDERYDLVIHQDVISRMKAEMEAMYSRLQITSAP